MSAPLDVKWRFNESLLYFLARSPANIINCIRLNPESILSPWVLIVNVGQVVFR